MTKNEWSRTCSVDGNQPSNKYHFDDFDSKEVVDGVYLMNKAS
jgi:hypothetical protein